MFTPPFFTKQQKLSLTFKLKTEIGREREKNKLFISQLNFLLFITFFASNTLTLINVFPFSYINKHTHRSDTSERGEKKKPLPFIVKTGYIQIMS